MDDGGRADSDSTSRPREHQRRNHAHTRALHLPRAPPQRRKHQQAARSRATASPSADRESRSVQDGSATRRGWSAKDVHSIETVHELAALGVGIVLWQAVEIGRNGVATWACWTDFHPGLWVVSAFLQYVVSVVVLRTSLRVTATAAPSSARQQPERAMSALACWDLTSPGIHLEVTRKRLVNWGKAIADLVNNVIYLYGTAVFSSLRLISGRAAIQKLAAFGITVAARMVAVFVLEDIDGED
jgi:hypothetical protein